MSDLIQIRIGNPPWAPAPGTELLDVIREYDGPLLVILRQNGTEYMGRCVIGELAPNSAWVFCRLDVHEAALLRQGSIEQIDETADYLTQGELTVAMVDADQILYTTVVDIPDGGTLERLRSLINQLQSSVTRVKADADQMSASLVRSR